MGAWTHLDLAARGADIDASHVHEIHLETQRPLRPRADVQVNSHLNPTPFGQHVHRLREHVRDERVRHDPEPGFAVDPAEREIVDPAAERRDIRPLCRVHQNGDHVRPVPHDVLGDLERRRQVAAEILADLRPVDEHRGRRHHPLEIEEDTPVSHRRRHRQGPAVHRFELERALVEAVPGQTDVGVWQRDHLEAAVVEVRLGAAVNQPRRVAPASVQRCDNACRLGGLSHRTSSSTRVAHTPLLRVEPRHLHACSSLWDPAQSHSRVA